VGFFGKFFGKFFGGFFGNKGTPVTADGSSGVRRIDLTKLQAQEKAYHKKLLAEFALEQNDLVVPSIIEAIADSVPVLVEEVTVEKEVELPSLDFSAAVRETQELLARLTKLENTQETVAVLKEELVIEAKMREVQLREFKRFVAEKVQDDEDALVACIMELV
jgi:hypothetical protein